MLAVSHDGRPTNDQSCVVLLLLVSVAVNVPPLLADTLVVTSVVFQVSGFWRTTKLHVTGLPMLVCMS